jgi:hypothetical protein
MKAKTRIYRRKRECAVANATRAGNGIKPVKRKG